MLQILTTILKIIFLDKSVEKNKLQIISIMKILWPNVLYVYLLKFALAASTLSLVLPGSSFFQLLPSGLADC